MSKSYASVSDINDIGGRVLTAEEQEHAQKLINIASAKLRITVKKYGKNLDALINSDDDYGAVAKEIIVRAVVRALNAAVDNSPAAVQASQAAMGYSVSMTYLNAGQSLYFLRNELKELGLLRQKYGVLEVYGSDGDCH